MKDNFGQKYLIVFRSIVRDDQGRVLIIRRSQERTYSPGKWELPGGKLGPGQDLATSIEEIINRETGLVVEPLSRRYYYQSRLVTENKKYQGYTYIEITGEAKFLGGSVHMGGDNDAFEWVGLTNVFDFDLTLESKKSLIRYASEVAQAEKAEGPGRIPVVLSAKALIKDARGRYLFLQRSRKGSSPLKWEMPGGKLDLFEVLEELLKREVFEETGLVVSVDKPAIYINSQVLNIG